jgi:hypothetical protein
MVKYAFSSKLARCFCETAAKLFREAIQNGALKKLIWVEKTRGFCGPDVVKPPTKNLAR